MNDFTFQNTTKVYFGRNQLGHLHEAVLDAVQADRRALGTADTGGERPVRVLLVYGGGSIKRMGLYDRVRAELKDSGIEVLDLGGVEPNPRHTTVNRGAALCKEHGVAAVLGVGGGSSIDCAKAVAAAACYTGTDVWDLVEGAAPLERALPVFAMPTMASTGSEMDKSCVISNVDLDAKRGLSSELIRPRASFLNPENTFTVSAYQTACGAFDILSHFLDLNYLANCEKYDLQNGVIESIMRTVVKNAPIALAEPDNYAARANLMWAASWALNSFCTSGMKMAPSCHNMEHELSACYDLTHGLGLAILTPRWMRYLLERDASVAADLKQLGVAVFGCDAALSEHEGAVAAIEAVERFAYETLGLKRTLTDAGIDDARFAEMAAAACGPRGVINGYRPLTPADVEAIYRMCL